jgi:hypothetical protein
MLGVASGDAASALMMPYVRLTIPFARRFAVEGSVGFYTEYEPLEGFYGVQIKQRIVRASNAETEIFATYGALGWYSFQAARTISYTYHGTTEVYHLAAHTDFQPPEVAVVGAGIERRVAARLALRGDVQGLVCVVCPAAGARVSLSVSMPIGRVND